MMGLMGAPQEFILMLQAVKPIDIEIMRYQK
jgi:hypothetical protein